MNERKSQFSFLSKPRYGFVHIGLVIVGVAICVVLVVRNRYKQAIREINAAVFESSIEEAKIADTKVVPDNVAYRQQYDFSRNWFTYNIPVWRKALREYKGKPDVHYLEIGAFEGRSAVWMLESVLTHASAKMTVIDVFQGPYRQRYFANLEKSGSASKVTTIEDYSQIALRKLPLQSFDIIYIDGSHAKDDVLEDAVLCFRLLKDDGILIFDDYKWGGWMVSGTTDSSTDLPKPAIDRFYYCFQRHFDVIHNSYQLILKKKARPSH